MTQRNAEPPQKPKKRSTNLWTLPFRVLFACFVLLTPLLSVWLASTLAVYLNGPLWLAISAGALLFPGLPLLWEWRSSVGKEKRWFKRSDRLILRTLFINLIFLGGMLYAFPQKSFQALATRGDWPLSQSDTAEATVAKATMLKGAEGLEWLYLLAHDNPYKKFEGDDGIASVPTPEPNPAPSIVPTPKPAPVPSTATEPKGPKKVASKTDPPDPKAGPAPKPKPTPDPKPAPDPPATQEFAWPMKASVHPVIASLPASVETNYTSVARYIESRLPNKPFQRVKAIHDYIATRVAYDIESLNKGLYPPQDARTVFETRKAVCAGYAKLFIAMTKVTGDPSLYITGISRELDGSVADGPGHAWNGVQIKGKWYLMDVTWDAGYIEGGRFKRRFSTAYLLTPPQVFIHDHFPEANAWQLLPKPKTRAEFIRSPMLRPGFYQAGLKLVSPTRSQVDVSRQVVVKLDNPHNMVVTARIKPLEGGAQVRCVRDPSGDSVSLTCPAPQSRRYVVEMFAGPDRRSIPFVGSLEVVGS